MELDLENNDKVLKLVEKLMSRLKARDISITQYNAIDEIISAINEYYNDRHFSPTESTPFEPIYADLIIQLAIAHISKWGAEGETTHSEGGVMRIYDSASDYPLALTQKIIPLAKGVD